MAERLRILHLVTGLATGGAQLHAMRVVTLLPRAQFEPAVFALWQGSGVADYQWDRRLDRESILVYGQNKPGDWRAMTTSLWRAITAFRPHVIHSHSEREDLLNALLRLGHPARPRAVRTVHIDQQWRTSRRLGQRIDNHLFPYLFSREIAVSASIQQLLLERPRRSDDNVRLCYNGLDETVFSPQAQPAGPLPDGLPATRPRVGIVGRLTEQKGHADLLAAMVAVRRHHPAQLIVVGEGPLRNELESQVHRLGLREAVHFLGFRQDVSAILSYLDVFVLPSHWEGFPTVLLEAMANGVPVIATDVSGSRELVIEKKTGRLVSPGNPEALACAIDEWLGDPAEAQSAAEAARRHAAGYTIQNTAACYASIYQELFSG